MLYLGGGGQPPPYLYMEAEEFTLADAIMQMNDGIHRVASFLRFKDGRAEYVEPTRRGLPYGTVLVSIHRNAMLDLLEQNGADDAVIESIYTEYNSFARSKNSETLYAWYNNDR